MYVCVFDVWRKLYDMENPPEVSVARERCVGWRDGAAVDVGENCFPFRLCNVEKQAFVMTRPDGFRRLSADLSDFSGDGVRLWI
jgi:hypothetical protein